jgi:hypothetical protein
MQTQLTARLAALRQEEAKAVLKDQELVAQIQQLEQQRATNQLLRWRLAGAVQVLDEELSRHAPDADTQGA